MVYTQVYLANEALDHAEAQNINSLTDTSEQARVVARYYETVLKTCLIRGATPWAFATEKIQLAANSTTPINEFTYEFDLPGDFLLLQEIFPKSRGYQMQHRVLGVKKLYTNYTPVVIKYTSDRCVSNPYMMSSDFAEYFALKLASKIVMPLKADRAARIQLVKDAEAAYRHAASSDAMQGSPEAFPDTPAIIAHESSQLYGFGQPFRLNDPNGNFVDWIW